MCILPAFPGWEVAHGHSLGISSAVLRPSGQCTCLSPVLAGSVEIYLSSDGLRQASHESALFSKAATYQSGAACLFLPSPPTLHVWGWSQIAPGSSWGGCESTSWLQNSPVRFMLIYFSWCDWMHPSSSYTSWKMVVKATGLIMFGSIFWQDNLIAAGVYYLVSSLFVILLTTDGHWLHSLIH